MSTPTKEQLTAARERGFANSISHLPPDKAAKFTASYKSQASKREAHLDRFRKAVSTK